MAHGMLRKKDGSVIKECSLIKEYGNLESQRILIKETGKYRKMEIVESKQLIILLLAPPNIGALRFRHTHIHT